MMNQRYGLFLYLQTFCNIFFILFAFFLFLSIFRAEDRLQKTILQNERKTRDSLSQIISIFATKSDSLQAEIQRMNTDLNNKIKKFNYDLYKIRIIQMPAANYSNDTVLLSRLLSGYGGR